MNALMDMKMFLSFLVTGNVVMVFLIGAYLWRHRDDDTLNTFFYGKCLQTIAWIIAIFRGGAFDLIAVSLANSLLFIGYTFEVLALLKLARSYHRSTRNLYLWFSVLYILSFHIILFFFNQAHIRIAFASVALVVILVLPVWRMTRGKQHSLLMHSMGYLYFILLLGLVARTIVALVINPSTDLDSNAASFAYGFSFIMINMTMILGGTGFILLLKEMTDKELVHLANYDDLTKTLNRRAFFAQTEYYLNYYAKKKQKLSFLLFDVDSFKCINDTHGHDIGDRVLRDLSRRIYNQIEPDHLFSRFGGDEFAILMPGMDEEASALLAERIRNEVAQAQIFLPNQPLKYTISIGLLTILPDQFTDIETLYISCDNALYGAKRNGKNGVYRGHYQEELKAEL
ncbi:diguanylate cyclase [Sporolactobacillus kofuensis]|uniref:Diguanylate cyclase n=1 Tax=Sporolactobacillus kofuensis TaxID=269672 RepID=A0ABW1WFM9_9BACL|nr:GGDEF domain-containing protein [Sporolactobacillus kofuensis]MCO7175346.1 diguanylate cyclase [Sporolactobacillus kofuensis]